MSALTVAEARARVADNLDDPNNVRWSAAKINAALRAAIAVCVGDFCDAGGDAFDEAITGTTTTTGALVIAAPLLHIRSVQLVYGDRRSAIRGCTPQDLEQDDVTPRNVSLVAVRDWQLSTVDTNQLIGVDAVTGPSWQAFDAWVCAQAALDLGVGDNDRRPGLEATWARYRQAVLARISTPASRPAPLPRMSWNFVDRLGWTWSAPTRTLQLGRMRGDVW